MPSVTVRLTVFSDAVKTEIDSLGRCIVIGWFRDEVSAIGAACEHEIMTSAILPELRKLPEVRVLSEYHVKESGHDFSRFSRGTVAKEGELGRRMVLLPGGAEKPWLKI